MTFNHRRPTPMRRVVTGACVAAASIVGTTTLASANHHSSYHGVFNETPTGSALGYDIHGSVKMTVGESTVVEANVAGLDPAKDYGSHLHNGTCATGGGGHYQDAEGGAATPPNELWLATRGSIVEPNPGGVGHANGSAAWQARTSSTTLTNALSVVVHEPGGARIACADLG